MISFSDFGEKLTRSAAYRVWTGDVEVPVYTCRISAYPFNTWWPGHQRPMEQSEVVSFVNLVSDEPVSLDVEPLSGAYEKIMLKPYSKGVKVAKRGEKLAFSLAENGGYVLELDDYHNCLYIFNNKHVLCEDPDTVTHYFGAGVHNAGKITLHSNESVYVDKDAYVYGCIFAENAENIRVFGNGIFDDSRETRIDERCYIPTTNGNIKFYDCRNVSIEGVGFTDSAIWCVNLFHCFDVKLDGVNVFGQWRYNTDGIDIVNCQRVHIQSCFVHSFDDSITIKGIVEYGETANTDMLIENCVIWCDWGKALELGLETACEEYTRITFRNCDVIRGGNIACDVQNGDCARVHGILFEDIRLELESSYTPHVYQKNDEQAYEPDAPYEIAAVAYFTNAGRFREAYAFLEDPLPPLTVGPKEGEPEFAAMQNITVRNVQVYCDERILAERGTDAVFVRVTNGVQGSAVSGILFENIMLNGVKVPPEKLNLKVRGAVSDLTVK